MIMLTIPELRRLVLALSVAGFLIGSLAACPPQAPAPTADLVLHNGVIYTVNGEFAVAQAVAVKDGVIVAVGSDEDLKTWIETAKEKIDLGGKTVVPGLIDAHAHLAGYAAGLATIDLVGTTGIAEIGAKVAAKVAELQPGEWIIGRGWDQNDWEVKQFPTAADLDAFAPEHPVLLSRVDGHAIWVNSKALELAGVTKATQAPSGGEIIRDAKGNPTGIFVDTAEGLIDRMVPSVPRERMKELLQQAVQNCLAVGLTGNHEMGAGPDGIALVKELIDEGKWPFRLYVLLSSGLPNLDAIMAEGHQDHGNGRLIVRAVKAYADGALGSRGAALLAPYSDRPDSSGLLISSKEKLQELTERCLKAGFQVGTHAIGDLGNRTVLDAYEAALAATGATDARLRVEHAQIISPEDMGRFKTLGVLPSMQPTHCTSDLPWAIERVGEERIKGAYAWRTLLDTGVIIPCGSDFPVEGINPIWGFYSAVTRKHQDGTPADGFFPEQKMSREEALKGFTIWAAWSGFMEDRIGSIEVGKRADFVILDRDIMQVPEAEILATKVVKTILDGTVVYNAEVQ